MFRTLPEVTLPPMVSSEFELRSSRGQSLFYHLPLRRMMKKIMFSHLFFMSMTLVSPVDESSWRASQQKFKAKVVSFASPTQTSA